MRAVTIILSAVCFAALVCGQDGPVVNTEYGRVKGGASQSRNNRMFYSFRGIPYAKAPERFQASVIPDKWDDVKDATRPAAKCIQYNAISREIYGQEDCLNVNVFTPKLPVEGQDKILLPVVVYIHPGLNNDGSNEDFDPKYFMDEDVILVIPNYRLGVFGFLDTGDKNAPGNAGLRDQVLALKWVKQNIEKFGGDKDRVTLLGSGSGAADAFIHTISPPSKGLINGIISMGGTTLSRTVFILNPVKHAKRLGTQVGCPVDSSDALVNCLKTKDTTEILEKMTKLDPKKLNIHEKAWFGPTVEKLQPGQSVDDLIVSDNPVKLLKEGKIVNKVPLIIGGNDQEGINIITATVLKDKTIMEKLDKQWNEIVPKVLVYEDNEEKEVISQKIRDFYIGDKLTEDKFLNLTDVFMDRFMGFGLVMQATLYSSHAPTWLYYFHHNAAHSGLQDLGVDKNYGMAHLDDLQYLFKLNLKKFAFPEITKDSGSEYTLSHNLVKLLGSFAETGKPTKIWGDTKEWKNIEAGNPGRWYKMGVETAFEEPAPPHFAKRIGLWSELYGKQLARETDTPVRDQF